MAAIQLPATRTATRAKGTRTEAACPANSDTTTNSATATPVAKSDRTTSSWEFGAVEATLEQSEQDREAANSGDLKRTVSGQQGAERDGDDRLGHGKRDLRSQ